MRYCCIWVITKFNYIFLFHSKTTDIYIKSIPKKYSSELASIKFFQLLLLLLLLLLNGGVQFTYSQIVSIICLKNPNIVLGRVITVNMLKAKKGLNGENKNDVASMKEIVLHYFIVQIIIPCWSLVTLQLTHKNLES